MEPTSAPPWMPTADRLRAAVERLVAAAQPKQIILFGSYARGDADDHSDIDLLVVERIVDDRYEEMIRLNRALRGSSCRWICWWSANRSLITARQCPERSNTRRAARAGFCMPSDDQSKGP